MPEQPFPITEKDPAKALQQMMRLLQELFEERIGGANIGDVFTIGADDILTISLGSAGGLEKSSSSIVVKIKSTGGLQTNADGISIKINATGGLLTTVDGAGIKLDGASLELSAGGLKLSDPIVLGDITLNNEGLHILDTDGSHVLTIKVGSDLTDDRLLTITTGDADRTITLTGNPTLADWFDQAVKVASSPSFAGLTKVGGAADYLTVAADGTIRFNGAATVFNDIYFPMSSGKIGGANQPTWGAFQGNIYEYTFALNDYIHLPVGEILHSYKEGSDITLHAHIVTNGSDVGITEVNYEIEYTLGDLNETMSAATPITSGNFTIGAGTIDRTHYRVEIGTITGTNYKTMAALKMRFRRIVRVGGTGDPAVDPFVLMVGAHIEEDTVGSRTAGAK